MYDGERIIEPNVTYSLSRLEYLRVVKNDTGLGANHTDPCLGPTVEVDSGSATKSPPKMVTGLSAPGDRGAIARVLEDDVEAEDSGRVESRPESVR